MAGFALSVVISVTVLVCWEILKDAIEIWRK